MMKNKKEETTRRRDYLMIDGGFDSELDHMGRKNEQKSMKSLMKNSVNEEERTT